MKKFIIEKRETIQNVINSVLATGLVVLFVLFFTMGNKQSAAPEANAEVVNSNTLVNNNSIAVVTQGADQDAQTAQPAQQQVYKLPIAVVNTDSILAHYKFAIDANDKLMSQYEASVVKLDTKAKSLQKEIETFQKDVEDFQRKVESGAFLSRERAESEQQKLQKKEQDLMAKQQDLENLRQQESEKFMAKQAELAQQLQEALQAYLQEMNVDGHFHLIINDAVVMNKVNGYDITNEVIDALNARYKK